MATSQPQRTPIIIHSTTGGRWDSTRVHRKPAPLKTGIVGRIKTGFPSLPPSLVLPPSWSVHLRWISIFSLFVTQFISWLAQHLFQSRSVLLPLQCSIVFSTHRINTVSLQQFPWILFWIQCRCHCIVLICQEKSIRHLAHCETMIRSDLALTIPCKAGKLFHCETSSGKERWLCSQLSLASNKNFK